MNFSLCLFLLADAGNTGWFDHYQHGEELLAHGQSREALTELRAALKLQPEHAAVLDANGRAETAAGNYRSAIRLFEKAVEASSDKAPSQTNLAMAHIAMGGYRRAEQLLRQVLASGAECCFARRALAQSLLKQRRYGEAAAILEPYADDPAADPVSLGDLSLLYSETNRPAMAAAVLGKAVRIASPGRTRVRLMTNWAVLLWKTGNRQESLHSIELAVQEAEAFGGSAHPDTAWVHEVHGQILEEVGRKKEARSARARAAEIQSSFAGQVNDRAQTIDWREWTGGRASGPKR